ncbi:hypothetical protein GCM10010423_27120 [Streptomyces levis]|uniref:Uncharacterized protein n=2 Tax=Streptomyces levis TaxID=285566 RepID=A0ABN3NSF2_9ACTN
MGDDLGELLAAHDLGGVLSGGEHESVGVLARPRYRRLFQLYHQNRKSAAATEAVRTGPMNRTRASTPGSFCHFSTVVFRPVTTSMCTPAPIQPKTTSAPTAQTARTRLV